MFPSAIIKKDKKKLKGTESAAGPLKGIDEIEYKPAEKTMKVEFKDLKGAKKVPESKVPSANKPKSEDVMSIDLVMQSAKKPKANAASSEGEEFYVNKDKKGMWSESGLAKEKYLKSIGKLKKGK